MYKICVIVILYNPSEEIEQKWASYVKKNKDVFFIFVDNSEEGNKFPLPQNAFFFSNNANLGIAAAQNIGISYACRNDFNDVLFFDQDSEICDDYIKSITCEFNRIREINPQIAVLGPKIVNKESLNEYKHNDFVNSNQYAVVEHLISSGSIVSVESIHSIGNMDERLFIDYVDFEWCWRAKNKGYLCARTHNVALAHKVGQKSLIIFGMPIVISSPFRYFYQYRNYLWLVRRSYVPTKWKLRMFFRKVVEFVILPIIVTNKRDTLVNIIRGIKAGVFSYESN